MKKFIFSILLLSSLSSLANDEMACESLGYFNQIKIESSKHCLLIKEYEYSLRELELINPRMPRVSISMKHEQMGASLDNSNTIHIAQNLIQRDVNNQKVYRSSSANIITFLHEYGHAVLASLLREKFDTYQEYQVAHQELDKKSSELNNIIDTISKKRKVSLENGNTQEEVEQAHDILRTLMPKYMNLGFEIDQLTFKLKSNRDFKKIDETISPLHELYADTIVVLLKKDLEAMEKAITFNNMDSKLREEYSLRSFSKDVRTDDWDNSQTHALFAPTRSYIGKIIFSMKDTEFLELLNSAVVQYVKEALSEDLGPKEMNQLLIEKLNSHITN